MQIPLTLASLGQEYAAGTQISAVIEQVYARIAEVADYGIFITLREKADVLAEASNLGPYDPAKPLWGVPFAVKDNIDVAGLPTTAACPAWEYMPQKDAFVVALLRAAGAIVIGKTNLDQFATGLVGIRTPYGAPKNALDPDIVPGGSSGGSGVAVAQGIVSFALGTDTAGSGRVPAALNNIVGLKPSLGSWSARGSVPACRSIETISVLALTVQDAHDIYRIGAEFDQEDPYSRRIATPPISSAPKGLRIGCPDPSSIRFFGDDFQAEAFAKDLLRLEDAGHTIVPLDFSPFYSVADMLYQGAWVAERHTVIEDLLKTDPAAVFPVTAKIIRHAETISSTDTFRGFYRLKELARQVEPIMESVDMLCVPTIPTIYTIADLEADQVTPNSNLGTYTNFVNLLDMCGLAVPTPPRADGRPASVTLLAASAQDALLASVAIDLENAGQRSLGATNWKYPEPRQIADLPSGYMKIAVCGAHMSGLPLNDQLTSKGGYFMSEAFSAPVYEMHLLPGKATQRPGMVRESSKKSNGIALEIWALPIKALGSFSLDIPHPLGIGKIELASGEWVPGFICEAAGVEGGCNITEFFGWRNFLKIISKTD